MQRDIATIIAVKILDTYNPSGNYSPEELAQLSKLIKNTILEEESRTGSMNFTD